CRHPDRRDAVGAYALAGIVDHGDHHVEFALATLRERMKPVPAAKHVRDAPLVRAQQSHARAIGETGPTARVCEVQRALLAAMQHDDERRRSGVVETGGRVEAIAPGAHIECAGEEAHATDFDLRAPPAAAPEAEAGEDPGAETTQPLHAG